MSQAPALGSLSAEARETNSDGQPVEQLGMAGRLALDAEVLGGLDQADAEVLLPEAIDGDARGQRVVRRQPASARGRADCSARPSAAAAERLRESPGWTLAPYLL